MEEVADNARLENMYEFKVELETALINLNGYHNPFLPKQEALQVKKSSWLVASSIQSPSPFLFVFGLGLRQGLGEQKKITSNGSNLLGIGFPKTTFDLHLP